MTKTTKIWSRRYNPAQGNYWKMERECTEETIQPWMEIFRNDEPKAIFLASARKPAEY